MIKRIVKLTIRAEKIDTFSSKFEGWKQSIRKQDGCQHLELWQDIDDHRLFYTYSEWSDQQALDAYRHSDLFAEVWPQTKALFDDKPAANSVVQRSIAM